MFKIGIKYKIFVELYGKQTFLTVLVKNIEEQNNKTYITFEDKFGNEVGYSSDCILHHREVKNGTD